MEKDLPLANQLVAAGRRPCEGQLAGETIFGKSIAKQIGSVPDMTPHGQTFFARCTLPLIAWPAVSVLVHTGHVAT